MNGDDVADKGDLDTDFGGPDTDMGGDDSGLAYTDLGGGLPDGADSDMGDEVDPDRMDTDLGIVDRDGDGERPNAIDTDMGVQDPEVADTDLGGELPGSTDSDVGRVLATDRGRASSGLKDADTDEILNTDNGNGTPNAGIGDGQSAGSSHEGPQVPSELPSPTMSPGDSLTIHPHPHPEFEPSPEPEPLWNPGADNNVNPIEMDADDGSSDIGSPDSRDVSSPVDSEDTGTIVDGPGTDLGFGTGVESSANRETSDRDGQIDTRPADKSEIVRNGYGMALPDPLTDACSDVDQEALDAEARHVGEWSRGGSNPDVSLDDPREQVDRESNEHWTDNPVDAIGGRHGDRDADTDVDTSAVLSTKAGPHEGMAESVFPDSEGHTKGSVDSISDEKMEGFARLGLDGGQGVFPDRSPRDAARLALETTEGGLLDYRRHSSEAAALAAIGGDAVNLDKVAGKGHKGGNYPTYDISSSNEVTSVKTHWGFGGAPKIDEYVRDFEKMLGWGRTYDGGRSPLEIDVRNILSAHDKEVPVPKELADAEPGDALDYLRGHSVLRIPDDHVDVVRAALEKEVRQFPSNYFLPENLTDGEVEAVLERVQGIGVTSTELGEMIEHKMQNPRAGK